MAVPHRNTVWHPSGRSAHRGVRGRPDACRALTACPRPRSASARLVSGVRAAMSTRPVSGVRCPVSAVSVRRPVSGVSAAVCSWSASVRRAATQLGEGARVGVAPTLSAKGAGIYLSSSLALRPPQAVLGSGGIGLDLAAVGRWLAAALLDRLAEQGQAGHPPGSPVRKGAGGVARLAVLRQAARRAPAWSRPWPGRLVACSGRALGLDRQRACGPAAAQAGSGCDRPGGGSAVSWENSGGPART
jgi:hypothetical protein